MSRNPHIASIETEEAGPIAPPEEVATGLTLDEDWALDEEIEPARSAMRDRLAPVAALALAGIWTGFFAWAYQRELLEGMPPQMAVALFGQWALPVLLLVAGWLLMMRLSTREAARFADSARALRLESERLEERLITVNRELSLAREFITAQGRDLEAFGRMASERLSQHAGELQSLVQNNSAQVDAIAAVSSTALDNMGKLRNDLPVVANAARDVTNQIGNVGRTAHTQLQTMIDGMDRLNQFGKASEQQVLLVRQRVEDALKAFETQSQTLEEVTTARFAELSSQSDAFRATLDGHEVQALAAIRLRAETLLAELQSSRKNMDEQEMACLDALRSRIATLRDEGAAVAEVLSSKEAQALAEVQNRLDSLLAQIDGFEAVLLDRNRQFHQDLDDRRAASSAHGAEEVAKVELRLAQFDSRFAQLRETQQQATADLSAQGDKLAAHLSELQFDMARISLEASSVQDDLAQSISKLHETLSQSRDALNGTDRDVSTLTDASVRLLELIQASAHHSETILPAALSEAERRLSAFREDSSALGQLLDEAAGKGELLSSHVTQARRDGQSVVEDFDTFYDRLLGRNREQISRLAELRSQLSVLAKENEDRVAAIKAELGDAITSLQDATRTVMDELAAGSDKVVSRLASEVAEKSGDAIDRAIEDHAAIAVGQLEAAASRAAAMGREAAIQLRDQLGRVDELASNLEARVNHARQRAEEQVDNDFARRVALITESLNSNAIDIAKALSNEVTDTAWASYLKGDRGVFTRRAVRLVENSESRAIAEIYENDPDFREHVSRYVHDFEAMMRTLLSTRDGHALSITLLSSDMGKLYVVLAQAIDRLRT